MTTVADDFVAVIDVAQRRGARVVRHPVWHGKVLGASGDDVVLLPSAAPLDAHTPSSVQLFFGDFAVVRSESLAPSVAFLLLFKTNGTWRIAGEAFASAAQGVRSAEFDPRTAEREVLIVLDAYYRAVETGTADALRRIFHPHWHMKNHEGDDVAAEDRSQFIRRIEAGPTAGYCADRQIADVQIVFDRLAFVRIDKPSTPGVTVFLLFKLNGDWTIVDKAWSMARG